MPKKNPTKNPDDSRAKKTRRDIKNALLSLIEKKPFAQIRVEEILKEAPVQSNTFYRYFDTKADVLDSIASDIVDKMRCELEAKDPQNLGGGGRDILPVSI